MSFSLVSRENHALPRLSWAADVTPDRVFVEHGPAVEVSETHAVEGAWSDDFPNAGFPGAMTFTGTGVAVAPERVTFATPTDTLHALFMIRSRERILCSNSLPFLLSRAGDDVDTSYPYYQADLMSVIHGLTRYRRAIPTLGGNRVSVVYRRNVVIDRSLRSESLLKASPRPFADYRSYVAFLRAEVAGVTANAGHSARKVPYEPLTSVSSGYDSPASAVLARSAGCREAMTFLKARRSFVNREDSGTHIGERLGLKVSEHDASAYLTDANLREVEFIATGVGADDVIFSAIEDLLPGRLLYTGFHGDKVWSRGGAAPSRDIVRGDASGLSMAEFRLRVGFLNLGVPFIGCVQHPSIHEVSNSLEMRPWCLGGEYDRPIPRRLVEEAGVPREWFGQTKKAAAIPFITVEITDPALEDVLSPDALRAFLEFVEGRPLFPNWRDWCRHWTGHTLYRVRGYLADRPALWRVSRWLANTEMLPRHAKDRRIHMYLFAWAMSRIRKRYEVAR